MKKNTTKIWLERNVMFRSKTTRVTHSQKRLKNSRKGRRRKKNKKKEFFCVSCTKQNTQQDIGFSLARTNTHFLPHEMHWNVPELRQYMAWYVEMFVVRIKYACCMHKLLTGDQRKNSRNMNIWKLQKFCWCHEKYTTWIVLIIISSVFWFLRLFAAILLYLPFSISLSLSPFFSNWQLLVYHLTTWN